MYISKLKLKNIRCFGEITINFRSNNDVCMWGMILGDNGVGKTTILRSVAMSLCGKRSIFGLLDEIRGDWIRRGNKNEGSIRLEMKPDDESKDHYYIQTTFTGESGNAIEISQETKPDPFPWDKLFFCGYGATRGVSGTESYRGYEKLAAIYTLFNEDAELQNPELPLTRILASDKSRKIVRNIFNQIEAVLMIPKGSIGFDKKEGITIGGPWGPSMPAIALGDGHRATMSWVVDFLSFAMFYYGTIFQKEQSAIVLIDEIEQHLHPQWQKSIVKLLREQFPRVQFIVTTHSPLCAIGTTDLNDNECALAVLAQDKGSCVQAYDGLKLPRNQRADQVLTSFLFGLTTSGDNATIHKIERYSNLMSRERTPEEEEEVQTLRNELDEILGTEETELQQLVAKSIQKVLEKKLKSSSFDQKAIDYEIKRQLRELFGDNK